MKYAPIVIPTLNRDIHLRRCIKSLQNNSFASNTDLFVAVDYPPTERYRNGYNKIVAYLKDGISGFKSVNVVYREKNFGSTRNLRTLVDEVFKLYDRIIVLEDDNELAPSFLEFCDKGLEEFEDDKSIIGLNASNYVWCGKGMRLKYPDDGNNIRKRQLIFHAMATWKENWMELDKWCFSGKILKDGFDIKKMKKLYNISHCFFYTFINNVLWSRKNLPWIKGRIYAIDQVWDYYMIMFDKYIIYPNKAMTRDWGCDGTGAHYRTVYENMDKIIGIPLDSSKTFSFRKDYPIGINKYEMYLHDKYNYTKTMTKLKEWLKYLICLVNKKRILEK